MTSLHLFKVDENLPAQIAQQLRDHGFGAVTATDQGLGGTADANLYDVCSAEGRALLTLDLGFGDIRSYPPEEGPGIVILRPRSQDRLSLEALVAAIIPFLKREGLAGRLWVVDEEKIRVRGES